MSSKLQQIGEKTGLSLMTVSRALRGIGRVNPHTRDTVLEAARELGYSRLNHVVMPRAIRSGRADHRLSLVLPVVAALENGVNSEIGREVVRGLSERLEEIGGQLRTVPCASLDELLAECGRSCHGVVLRLRLPSAWIEALRRKHPVVYAISQDFQCGVDSLYTNEHRSAAMVLDHLSALGHRDIAWFGVIDRDHPGDMPQAWVNDATVSDWRSSGVHGPRYAAWAQLAYCQLGHQRQPMLLLERDWKTQSLADVVAQGLKRLLALSPRPSAIVVATDAMGIALLEAARGAGLEVPRDLSILSYGGSSAARNHVPPLTTIALPMRLIGRAIPELIERRLATPDAAPISMLFETTLVKGGTVGPWRQEAEPVQRPRSKRSPSQSPRRIVKSRSGLAVK